MFSIGTFVRYKEITGPIVYATQSSISILMREASHPSEEVRIVVPHYEFENVQVLSTAV